MSELDMLVDMAHRGKAAGDPYLAHMDGKAAAINYVRVADLVASLRPTSVLDWGCGYGQVSWLLKRRGLNVSSCDLGQSAGVSAVAELASVPVTQLTHAYELPYENESFDMVLSV